LYAELPEINIFGTVDTHYLSAPECSMPNRKLLRQQKQAESAGQLSNLDRLQDQLQDLVDEKSYRRALDKIKQINKMHPEAELRFSEAEIWSLQGQEECRQGKYRQAQTSLGQAIALSHLSTAYYWLAKSLLATNDTAAALKTIRIAFDRQILAKDDAGCYLKLLFLTGAAPEVADLIASQAKRFTPAQIQWAKGVLSFQAGNLQAALGYLKKMGRPATPGDTPTAWIAHTQQQLGNWQQSASLLAIPSLNGSSSKNLDLYLHEALRRLALVQAAAQPKLLAAKTIAIEGQQRILGLVLELLQCLDRSDYHNAAHVLIDCDRPCREFPAIDDLYQPVMHLAADQAVKTDELDCAEAFLESIVYQPPFNIQVAIKLRQLYRDNDAPIDKFKRLLEHVLNGIKKMAREQPGNWPQPRLNNILAEVNCWLTDAWVTSGSALQGFRALQIAVQLAPDSPEVIGRQGLKAYVMKEDSAKVVALLTQALEGGCHYEAVYECFLEHLKEQGDFQAARDIRRRFGQKFGDVEEDHSAEIPQWIAALSTQKYQSFAKLVQDKNCLEVPLKACQIFVNAVVGEPTNTGRVGFDLEQATEQWEQLLQKLSVPGQIPTIQAIFLTVQLFAKRQKGIAALQTQYLQRLLAIDHPEARLASLVAWAVKGDRPEPLQAEIRNYLSSTPQPGTALAHIQLQARRYGQIIVLRPLMDEFLRRDSQNPQLLLAQATTYPVRTKNYQELKEQGFELARRLQDAAALQAYRDEEAIQSGQKTGGASAFPDFMDMDSIDSEIVEMARQKLYEMFGRDIPPDKLATLLPIFMNFMNNQMNGFEDDDDDDDDYFDFEPMPSFFSRPPTRSKSKTAKSRAKQKKRKSR
jgi:tetratricopeptide (TPR) repeat protein